MAYKCPRCGENVSRGYSKGAQVAAGLIGALFYAAFGAFECNKCGKIPRSEFPSRVQAKMALGTLIMVLLATGIAIGVMALLANMD